jgi:hypothetical protein
MRMSLPNLTVVILRSRIQRRIQAGVTPKVSANCGTDRRVVDFASIFLVSLPAIVNDGGRYAIDGIYQVRFIAWEKPQLVFPRATVQPNSLKVFSR